MYDCPKCGKKLEEITYPANSPLNREQWASQVAGDYVCRSCEGTRGKSGFRYYWKSELEQRVVKETA